MGDCWSPVGQRIVVCCWRAMKEIGLLVQEIVDRVPLPHVTTPSPDSDSDFADSERENYCGGLLSVEQVAYFIKAFLIFSSLFLSLSLLKLTLSPSLTLVLLLLLSLRLSKSDEFSGCYDRLDVYERRLDCAAQRSH